MITAKEAREQINALREQRNMVEQKSIERAITRAIQQAESNCILSAPISYATEQWLESLGYTVLHFQFGEGREDVKIEW